jgi:glucose-1-phosphate cytidylyltransferase
MKAVILAGGLGTRLAEETDRLPKPMIQIGDRPMLWHVMKLYSSFGIDDFVICLGYRGYVVKEYFANYSLHMADITIDMTTQETEVHQSTAEPWRVTLVDTGEHTMTGGRIKRIARYLDGDDFCLTYGDGVSDVDIGALIEFHRAHGQCVTVTAVQPPGRFGAMKVEGDRVVGFQEKPQGDNSWINGGFFVLSPAALEYIDGDGTIWERGPMEQLSADGELVAFKHTGFWHAMDTLRDRNHLQDLWVSGRAPWKRWP